MSAKYCVGSNHLVSGSRYSMDEVPPKSGTLVCTPGLSLNFPVVSLYCSLCVCVCMYVR